MKAAHKHKIYCSTESAWIYSIKEDDSQLTACPNDPAHSITSGSGSIESSITKEIIGTEILIGKTSDKMKLRGKAFIATKNSSTTENYDINEDFYIKDGMLIADKNVLGDTVDISLADQADNVLYEYVKDYPISIKQDTGFIDQTLSDTNFNGLRLKITYHSTGTIDDVCVGLQLNGQN